ncbi:MAG: aminoacyl-tRNA hydrolase [Solobacterium sp.]|nr:aminoacyl-tRNA hydrolase [Solobacterium sp.]
MKLIAGLGNPGKEYRNTRHNSGFMVMDYLLDQFQQPILQEKWNALITKQNVNGENVLLMKPLTFMNRSGDAIQQVAHYYDIEPEDILIIHDDMDLPVGSVRIRKKGSSGGQKGMQSIIDCMGTNEIPRIRIGVGHSKHEHEEVVDWVLSSVPKEEKEKFEIALKVASEAAYAWINQPMEIVMAKYNLKEKREKEDKPKKPDEAES